MKASWLIIVSCSAGKQECAGDRTQAIPLIITTPPASQDGQPPRSQQPLRHAHLSERAGPASGLLHPLANLGNLRPSSYHGGAYTIGGIHPNIPMGALSGMTVAADNSPRQPTHRRSMPLDPGSFRVVYHGPCPVQTFRRPESALSSSARRSNRKTLLMVGGRWLTPVEQDTWDYRVASREALRRGEGLPEPPAQMVDISWIDDILDCSIVD
jgi:hypothetical protein